MVNQARLDALDGLLWLGNGTHAARLTSLSQPTISRGAHQAADHFQLGLRKIRGEWQLQGDSTALEAERQHFQQLRFNGEAGLRLEAGAISSRCLAEPPPEPWILGRADAINQPRSLALLRERVIDAWICTSAQDLPWDSGEDIAQLDLFRAPLRLVASRHHPLVGQPGLTPSDLSSFPSVALASDWYPHSAAQLRSHGLWGNPQPQYHYRSHHWEGRTADGRTLAYASPVMLARNPRLHLLDFDLDLEQVVALVVLREHICHPRIQELQDELERRVEVLRPSEPSALVAC
ncbi:MAG: LysR substrate-binding domain-containing protein [Cyanobacteriota bacterium]|nr:LysR substrate-binding domain-containing protein [Cyanobacteriota bacterium]